MAEREIHLNVQAGGWAVLVTLALVDDAEWLSRGASESQDLRLRSPVGVWW